MSSGFGVNLGKTKFIEDYLEEHRGARFSEIAGAWKDAGHDGTVSESLVGKVRGKIKQRELEQADDDDDAFEEAGDSAEASDDFDRSSGTPSKSSFVADMLARDPSSNVRAVNDAWSGAGYEGTISDPIFYKVKKRLMLADGTKYQKGRPGRPPLSRSGQAGVASRPVAARPAGAAPMVDEVEAGIDDLMFRLKSSGGMPEVEAALRSARRLLVQGR